MVTGYVSQISNFEAVESLIMAVIFSKKMEKLISKEKRKNIFTHRFRINLIGLIEKVKL